MTVLGLVLHGWKTNLLHDMSLKYSILAEPTGGLLGWVAYLLLLSLYMCLWPSRVVLAVTSSYNLRCLVLCWPLLLVISNDFDWIVYYIERSLRQLMPLLIEAIISIQ